MRPLVDVPLGLRRLTCVNHGLSHMGIICDVDGDGGADHVYYNGYRAGEHIVGPVDYQHGDAPVDDAIGARFLGIEHMAEKGVQGRGVMVDLHAHFGNARTRVGYDELMRVMELDQVEIAKGDILALHTGLGQTILDKKKTIDPETINTCAVLNGRDDKLLQWIFDSDIAAIVADNYGVEDVSYEPAMNCQHAMMPLHEQCLFKLGVHLGELWYLTELARWLRAHRRNRFMLTAPPLRLPGAAGSPVTPIATV